MVRVIILALVLITPCMAGAQDRLQASAGDTIPGRWPVPDFKGEFILDGTGTEGNNAFMVNLSGFSSRFERVYYMNLSFSVPDVVNIYTDPELEMAVFVSGKKNLPETIRKSLLDLRTEVVNMATEWSKEMQSDWLKTNDKYH